jgi:hypothetical protein
MNHCDCRHDGPSGPNQLTRSGTDQCKLNQLMRDYRIIETHKVITESQLAIAEAHIALADAHKILAETYQTIVRIQKLFSDTIFCGYFPHIQYGDEIPPSRVPKLAFSRKSL